MILNPFRPAKAFREWLSLEEWSRESGLPKTTIRNRAARGEIQRTWQDYRHKKQKRWMYSVADLPESCGSAYLVDYLLREATNAQARLNAANDALERVMFHRRVGRAA